MKKSLNLYISGIALTVLVSFFANEETMNYNYLTMAGLTCLVLSVLGLFVCLVLFISKDKQAAIDLLIASGMMFLTGFITYFSFPVK